MKEIIKEKLNNEQTLNNVSGGAFTGMHGLIHSPIAPDRPANRLTETSDDRTFRPNETDEQIIK